MSDTQEESGPPVTETGPVRPPVIITPPPLTLEQADKIAKAIEAIEAAIESLGTVGGAFARLLLGKVLEGLRAMGPIPPLGPSGETEEPSTPPSATP
jgi:hypothetical protein